jgi:hypothetical protein
MEMTKNYPEIGIKNFKNEKQKLIQKVPYDTALIGCKKK